MSSALGLLDGFLRTPMRIICVNRDTFTGLRGTFNERILTHRYIRVLRGALTYHIDEDSSLCTSGSLFFVPQGAARHWQVPEGEIAELLWCEFLSPGVNPDPHVLWLYDDAKPALEKSALLRMERKWKFPRHLRGGSHGDPDLPPATALEMEGELKASLARFWCRARPWEAGGGQAHPPGGHAHPAVRLALQWMEEHFRDPEAHHRLLDEIIQLSPNHFRLLFARYSGGSVSAHLLKLRMLEAMRLLRNTPLSIKEVAATVGFNDPLYFSRRFREYWDLPPTAVRR